MSVERIPISSIRKGDYLTAFGCAANGDRSYTGDLLEVLIVDEPFVICKSRSHHRFMGDQPTREVIDANRYSLKRVSGEFVEAFRGGE